MLTRENFNYAWTRPKTGKPRQENMAVDRPSSSKKVGKEMMEDMVVDRPTTATTKGGGDVEMESVETLPEEGGFNNGARHVKNPRSWTSIKMPIFAFQRHGIGSIKAGSAKSKYPPKSKN
jgi:hypothetical protein